MDQSFFPEVASSHHVFASKWSEHVQQEEERGNPHTVRAHRKGWGMNRCGGELFTDRVVPVGRRHVGGSNAAR